MAEIKSEKKPTTQIKHIPKDAQVIMSIIREMGIFETEPKVINQLLEFTYRYVTCILEDAKTYANHAAKKCLGAQDVRFAVQSQTENNFMQPLPREQLIALARAKNSVPLPLVKPHSGLRLPADRYCLNSANLRRKLPTRMPPNVLASIRGERSFKVVAKPKFTEVSTPRSAVVKFQSVLNTGQASQSQNQAQQRLSTTSQSQNTGQMQVSEAITSQSQSHLAIDVSTGQLVEENGSQLGKKRKRETDGDEHDDDDIHMATEL